MDHVINSNQIYGVLPYIAPEVLCGKNPSTASDIYSFGIIVMNIFATGKRPWYNRAHDINLAKIFVMVKELKFLMILQNFMQS